MKDYATVTLPLTESMQQDIPQSWGEKEQAVFEKLKGLVSITLRLDLVDSTDPAVLLELVADVSRFALKSVFLTQVDRTLFPLAYYNRNLSDAE